MLIRISLILAIVAALGAGALNFFVVKDKLDMLVTQRDTERHDKETAQNDLAKTKKQLTQTQNKLSDTQQQLVQANTERDQARTAAAAAASRAEDLSTKLADAIRDRDDAQNQLAAYKATGRSPDQIGQLVRDVKAAQDALKAANDEELVMSRTIKRLTNELNELVGPDAPIKLPAELKGKIVVVDPKWDFVVLNIGEVQGVLQDGQLLVSRDGKLVAKIVVRHVDKEQCIANIIPGWKLGEVIEGDEVTPAYPAS